VQRTAYLSGRPPVRGTSFARSRFGRPAQRSVAIFDANSDRAAFDFVPQRPFARAAAARPFLRVGLFGFICVRIVDRSLGISQLVAQS